MRIQHLFNGYLRFVPWYLNPLKILGTARDARSVASGGGPKSVRLTRVGNPRGLIIPRVPIALEVVGKDGSQTGFELELPVGLVAGYGYRVARLLGLPLIRDLKPEKLRAEVRIPGR